MNWTVDETLNGERLDQALTALDRAVSRAQWQKRIKEGSVLVNGKPSLVPHLKIASGDVLAYEQVAAPERIIADYALPKLNVVAETDDWIVLDKPAGVLVHPVDHNDEPTLVDALLKKYPSMAKIGAEPQRPGIIHRLDKDVSGLMVVAKTQAAFDGLSEQFRQRKIDKSYQALVHGIVARDEGDIRFKLARSVSQGRMAARPEHDETGKVSWTHYTVLERTPGATLLKVNIYSGRTHQIRAHLFALNHAVFGDTLYVKKNPERGQAKAPRLMLQSVHLSFRDPASGETKTFDLPPVPEFEQLLSVWRTKGTPLTGANHKI